MPVALKRNCDLGGRKSTQRKWIKHKEESRIEQFTHKRKLANNLAGYGAVIRKSQSPRMITQFLKQYSRIKTFKFEVEVALS